MARFRLNHRAAESDSFKAGHKILWRHVRGEFMVGEAFIDIGVIPHIFALIGYVSTYPM
jgi:hypothetical protein